MLDTTGYLSSFGWQGKGNGLRQGSVSRPLAIPQKRTLSGLGKDRDEAFPFWDHLFAAASKSIKIKVSEDEDDADDDTSISPPSLVRTTTGILSNRRPILGTPASSRPDTTTDQTLPRLGLMAIAKRTSARQRLYAGFFKGPVLGPDIDPPPETESTSVVSDAAQILMIRVEEGKPDNMKRKHEDDDPGDKSKKSKKSKDSKRKDVGPDLTILKEWKKEKRGKSGAEAKGEDGRRKRKQSKERTESVEEKRQRKAAKLERRRRKDERRNAKLMKQMASSSRGNHD